MNGSKSEHRLKRCMGVIAAVLNSLNTLLQVILKVENLVKHLSH